MRSRTRTCTNPSPKNGGKTCLEQDLGPAKETEKCSTDPCGMFCCIYKGLACIAGGRVDKAWPAILPRPMSTPPLLLSQSSFGNVCQAGNKHLRLMTTKFGE